MRNFVALWFLLIGIGFATGYYAVSEVSGLIIGIAVVPIIAGLVIIVKVFSEASSGWGTTGLGFLVMGILLMISGVVLCGSTIVGMAVN